LNIVQAEVTGDIIAGLRAAAAMKIFSVLVKWEVSDSAVVLSYRFLKQSFNDSTNGDLLFFKDIPRARDLNRTDEAIALDSGNSFSMAEARLYARPSCFLQTSSTSSSLKRAIFSTVSSFSISFSISDESSSISLLSTTAR